MPEIVSGPSLVPTDSPVRSLNSILDELRPRLPELRKRFRVHELWVFGSYARGEQMYDSDLDILYTGDERLSLLDEIALEDYLSEAVGIKIDLVSRRALHPIIAPRALAESVAV